MSTPGAAGMTPDQLEELKARVTEAVEARGGIRRGKSPWVKFPCPNGAEHKHGDRTPSAGWDPSRGVWKCFGCNLRGGTRDLALRLGVPLPARGEQRETARWTIRDVSDRPIAVHIRLEPGRDGKSKDCVWERPDGRRGLGGLPVTKLPLYGVHELPGTAGATVVGVEGEKAKDALAARGIVAVGTVTGAATIPSDDVLRALVGYDVVLWPDADATGRQHMRRIGERLTALGIAHHTLEPWPDATDGRDAADFTGSTADIRALIVHATPERDDTVDAGPTPTPNGTPLLAGVLEDVEAVLRRYVVFPHRAHSVACVLWIAHAHAIAAAEVTPYLAILSPEKRCGKSRLLELFELLVPRAWLVGRPSEAALFRVLSEEPPPTLLFDEVDTVFKAKAGDPVADGIRAVLNMGYRQGATVPRCVPPSQKVQRFAVFGAKALAGIGALPDTVFDRAIPIRLKRKRSTELVARWRRREVTPLAEALHARLAAWAETHHAVPATIIEAPETLNDRAGEIWEPLLTIADLAGPRWLEDAREAARALHNAEADSESVGVLLLAAVSAIFAERDQDHLFTADRILTADLLRALVDRVEEPWAVEWGRDVAAAPEDQAPKGPAARLATLLRPFGIQSRPLRDGDRKGKGYFRADFADAFARYLPSPDVKVGTTGQSAPDADSRAFGERDTTPLSRSPNGPETLAAQGLSPCPDFQTQDGVDNGEDEEVIA